MNNIYLKNIIRFILLVLLQVLVLNNMNLMGYMNPYVYILFILLLPADISGVLLLLLAFLTGITIDFFGNTLGLNAAATVLMAFTRPKVLNLFFKNIEFGQNEEPGIAKMGFGKFLRYVFILVLIHHTALFFLEVFSFQEFRDTVYRIIISSVFSTFIIMILVLLFGKRKQ
ncbi:MAG: rod shape-determining protein MreD [Chlorobi bacterium]|nr:rod shape-determining protein MreD [Chlorobiota bacterium]